ncbi:SusD/RagB family nutrient-binding outer membrane lipoprotein [uncultured Bacteroides sp.]|uniref:SusD/RagB family nutrient-binding outer membrane lipoprotein n=1 Tax=uncultured Bacteroides sp. TaxID=162156 RepID=UPI002AA7046D|nr:SusD/RagB family nutrient-binding outer membrane lipoprotein [uncultured Bacteroides sp.]
MKRIHNYIFALISAMLLLSSCGDNFFDINTDPNNPAGATPKFVLPSGISGSAYVVGGYYQTLGSFWSQHYAQSPGASQWGDLESYNLTEDDYDRQFTLLYAGSLLDLDYTRKVAAKAQDWKYYSIATLMQAYTLQVVADLYDQVPFTEAFQGTANLQPHYDKGSLVYDSLFVRIDDAMSKDFTNSTVTNPGASDLIFGGDMNKWKAFANTLKLKLYMRYVNVSPTKYANEIKALLNENNFLTSDAAVSAFKDEANSYNPFYGTFIKRLSGNVVASNTLLSFLQNNSDPRISKLFIASATGSTYAAVPQGAYSALAGKTIKNYCTPNVAPTAPVYFFTKEEVQFLKAEAEARYGSAANAEADFNSGVQMSLVSLGLSKDAIVYPYNGIQSIIEQKWIAATNKNAIESFFDINRTGYPNFLVRSAVSVFSGDQRPKRLFFPAGEQKSNSNVPAKVALTEKVWWGK